MTPSEERKDSSLPGLTLAGRYTLTTRIATGGMAEIYLAKQKSLPGFEKQVVIKILQRRYRDDALVRRMFMDEAHIGAYLNHPHIVHVYDVAEHEQVPFIVMEHIDGEDLSTLCRDGFERNNFLPLEHAVELIFQAAAGMGYFHASRDADGNPLQVVHRDISPPNLLITKSGVLKIIDFGIARSVLSPGDVTDKRTPGKFNYMSPEQVRGEPVDQRSDVFSLGIVLYEITVGRRLFRGAPEHVMQEIVKHGIKPPTFVRRDFPPGLEAIIMRALEKHRADRYASAYELASALRRFSFEYRLDSGPVKIAQYLDDLRAAAGHGRRPELALVGEAWQDDGGEDALDMERDFSQVKRAQTTQATAVADPEPAPEPRADAPSAKSVAPAPARSRAPVFWLVGVLAAIVAAFVWVAR